MNNIIFIKLVIFYKVESAGGQWGCTEQRYSKLDGEHEQNNLMVTINDLDCK